ncbi:hypothetical protein KL918_003311 [Ogataea parapolymorpha]|uniref:amidase n=1 Tax=Ogataea parapolymorpha (strain ATCC 26012 / BCRC 20466 / JCM 22074 / NRRL Y-7560 / DL-1) TaxID=871575 RepID=W1Q767_OGAPD|nr:hypothetical protein HPODL_02404 [Ogataea parapolymorpha DL-1]ESW95752.1 hypothetical protein HPODL_02404 [Ogataea parapolymorpha DL-1]KAG7866414.1 hypothetical protein KL918_003311 [Ogataea parapolymorpha]KAG7872650.1 hypothetical protein KL916_003045 [Ogataea parapolymorpha]
MTQFRPTYYGKYTNNTEDPALFETFKPKIEVYRAKLASGILDKYALPKEVLVQDPGSDVARVAEKVLTPNELAIVDTPAHQLVKQVASGRLSAVQVFEAFAKTATAAHQATNCAMELFLDEGLKRAQELDEYYKQTGKTVGPLHGLPISLKEHYAFKGKVTHGATVANIESVSQEWCSLVKILLDAGAVFYIRTTEPQSLMHLCSNNNITGKCCNPHNTRLTPGGSSSGEGAIVAMKGSAIGVGSDIGGSIRAPAAFCGVFGLRPTQKRLTMQNCTANIVGVGEAVVPVLGPLARHAEDLDLFMKVQIGAKPWETDPSIIPLPWREVSVPAPKDIRVAVIYDDGVVKPTPPILRGLKYAADKLKAVGAKVVEWESFGVEELVKAVNCMYNADGNQGQKAAFAASGEPLFALTKNALSFGKADQPLLAVEEHLLVQTREEYRERYLRKMLELDVDYILSPTYFSVAPKLETARYWGYTSLWNILDFPNVVFPTGLRCEPALDAPDNLHKPRNDIEAYEYALYDSAEDFKNAPISLQLTGKRWFDEELVKAAGVVHQIVLA